MRLAAVILGAVIVAYGLLVAILYWWQDRFLFMPSTARIGAAQAGLPGMQDVVLETPDGERLVAWWSPPDPGRALILYFHGNGGSLLNRRERVRALKADGRGLLIASYRGYSGSSGSPSETGLAVDAETAYRFVSDYAPGRIVLYGESLGSGVAVRLAAEHPVGALILDAPFTSIPDVAQRIFWFVPVAPFLRSPFRSIDRIAAIKAPLLVLHGARDALIPIALGRRLYEAAPKPKRFVALPQAQHETVLERGGLAEVRAVLAEVEARLGVPASP